MLTARPLKIFNIGIPIPGKDGLYIETGPWSLRAIILAVEDKRVTALHQDEFQLPALSPSREMIENANISSCLHIVTFPQNNTARMIYDCIFSGRPTVRQNIFRGVQQKEHKILRT